MAHVKYLCMCARTFAQILVTVIFEIFTFLIQKHFKMVTVTVIFGN